MLLGSEHVSFHLEAHCTSRITLPSRLLYYSFALTGIAHWYSAGLRAVRLGVLFTTRSRPALGPTQPPIQWVLGALSLGIKRPGVKLTTHLHLVLRSRMPGAVPPLPQYAIMTWCSVKTQGQLYLYTLPTELIIIINWDESEL
jgi:hypothetical protein